MKTAKPIGDHGTAVVLTKPGVFHHMHIIAPAYTDEDNFHHPAQSVKLFGKEIDELCGFLLETQEQWTMWEPTKTKPPF